jgi:phage antirepressor YoqD-like protein
VNELQIIKGIECYVDEQGTIQLNLDHVARGLGYTTVAKSGNDVIRWARVLDYLGSFGFAASGERPKFIPEPIFYLLAMKADNEKAREFQRVVAFDVLPTIRKHGMYATDELLENPDLLIKVATALKEERERRKKLETEVQVKNQIIGELKPKADYLDQILKNKGLVTITQIAKDYGMSGKAMNGLLHDLKIQYKQSEQWLLYSQYQDLGYTYSNTVDIERKDGTADIKMNTKWTQKGRLFLYDKLKEKGHLPTIEK